MSIVLVSGGFDPLHDGHLDLFEGAALHGRVIVALNSDEWLMIKKGWVFMPWSARARLLKQLKIVFDVTAFDDANGTACNALHKIRPTYFANGGDRDLPDPMEHETCQKLGIKEGARAIFINAPENYDKILGPLPDKLSILNELNGPLDFIQFFTKSRAELEKELPKLKQLLVSNGMIWVSWPKKSSGVETDMTEDEVRRIAIPLQLVDIKVCAVDEIWSGLKLVIRVESR